MHQTSVYIQHTNQNMSNTQNMHIRFLFDPHEPKLIFFFSAAISALAEAPLPNLTPDCALADSLAILMPRPLLELNIMKTWANVGGCDAWMGNYWRPNQQWWVGWHSPRNLPNWAWPSDDWVLIGYERWYQPRRGDPKLLEAFYASPNPSAHVPPCPPPNGQWACATATVAIRHGNSGMTRPWQRMNWAFSLRG